MGVQRLCCAGYLVNVLLTYFSNSSGYLKIIKTKEEERRVFGCSTFHSVTAHTLTHTEVREGKQQLLRSDQRSHATLTRAGGVKAVFERP